MRISLAYPTALLLLAAFGCTQSTTAEPDSGITFTAPDVGPDTGSASADAAPDAGEVAGDIGIVCMSDADCDSFCAADGEGFRDGYCTNFCDDDNPCPSGSACLQVNRDSSICFAGCDPSADERQCRAGYGCAASVRIPEPVCVPGCTDDTDCDEGRTCNPASGGNCYNSEATWGDACDDTASCQDTAFCFAEEFRGWPGGMCLAFGCDPAADDGGGCPEATECLPIGPRGHGLCVVSCEDDEGCRPGYSCRGTEDNPERLACQPACDDDAQCGEGRSCGADGVCE